MRVVGEPPSKKKDRNYIENENTAKHAATAKKSDASSTFLADLRWHLLTPSP